MRPATASLLGTTLLLALPACKKPETNVSVADPDQAEPVGREQGSGEREVGARPEVQKIRLTGHIAGVGDMLDGGTKLITRWGEPFGAPPTDLRGLLAMGLIQSGFGPGFLDSLALDQVHGFELAYPHEDQAWATEQDVELVASLAATDPVRAIESLPAAMQPQPLGQNLWQISEEDFSFYLRASQAAVELGLTVESLDRAAALRSGAPDPRVRLKATNLPKGDIDLRELIPLPGRAGQVVGSIIDEATSAELVGDFGTDRDLFVRVGLDAPFERLGLEPLGAAATQPSTLAPVLPGDAIGTVVMPWGNPRLLHEMLDKGIPINQIPAPFNSYVGEVIKGSHAVLDQVRGEVLASAYLDGKQQMVLVLAAEVKDEAAARAALRDIWGAAEKAFGDHIALTGGSADHKYSVEFKTDAVKVGKHEADSFTLTVPKDMEKDVELLGSLLGRKKPKLEVITLVADGKAMVLIGAGARGLATEVGRRIGKSGKDLGLETEGGLALARKLADGCHFCVALDAVELFRWSFAFTADNPDEPAAVRKHARESADKLRKFDLQGQLALAARFDAGRGALGVGVPKTLLFPDAKQLEILIERFKGLDEARAAEAEAKLPAGVPGGVPGGTTLKRPN